jgi:hypothetical protein
MSRIPGNVMIAISEAIDAHPARRFTFAELAALAYPGETIERWHLVSVRRAVRSLVTRQRVSIGQVWHKPRPLKTVRAFEPQP